MLIDIIDVEKIKVSNRIRKEYGDIQKLADDIAKNGLLHPITVTMDGYQLIAGERRLRAVKKLGLKQICVHPVSIKDAEDMLNIEIAENELHKSFSKAERIDYAKRLERIEAAKAKERQIATQNNNYAKAVVENFPQQDVEGRTRDIVASKLGIGSGKQYEKEKYIVENKDMIAPADFADWDEGKLSTNKVFNKLKQEKEKLENEIKNLKSESNKARHGNSKADNSDLQNRIKILQQEVNDLQAANNMLELSKQRAESLAESYKSQSEEYSNLKSKLLELEIHPDGEYNIMETSHDIAYLSSAIEEFLNSHLSPIRYSKIIPVVRNNKALQKNMENLINTVDEWCVNMCEAIGIAKEKNIIDVIMEEN